MFQFQLLMIIKMHILSYILFVVNTDNNVCNKNIFITSLANYEYNQKIRCGTCSQRISVPERTTRNILEKYDIKYLPEYKFKDCKDKRPLPFDFYLPEYNILIELDGEHHYHPKWGDEQLKYIQNHDKIGNCIHSMSKRMNA